MDVMIGMSQEKIEVTSFASRQSFVETPFEI
jgi:hypothetical protein